MDEHARSAGVTVAALFVYPLKSCRGIALERACVTPQGLAHPQDAGTPLDRQWCVCNEEGRIQDQRVQPKLATLEVALEEAGPAGAGASLLLRPRAGADADLGELRLPVAEAAYAGHPQVTVSDRHRDKWFGRPLNGLCAGAEAAGWITRFVHRHNPASRDEQFRIVRYASSVGERRIRESFGGKSPMARRSTPEDTAAFADCAPYHLLTEESLADLSERLPADSGVERPVSVRRFRPNILLRGVAAPYAEDDFWHFTVGPVLFRQLGPTGRCVIPTTSPETGKRDAGEEPRNTLLGYRPLPYGDNPHGGPTLGVWAVPEAVRVLALGDPVGVARGDAARL